MPDPQIPDSLSLTKALAIFVQSAGTQSQRHIKPVHQYIATRLVIEGGFLPDEITPHPPLRVETVQNEHKLIFDPGAAGEDERTVMGGLKTKDIDVVVEKAGVGPVLAVSVKGTTGAFRNLTNRMEEAIGDSTNLHIMYPGLVYGFFQIIKANREGAPGIDANDVAIQANGTVVTSIRRYHDVLANLAGRQFVRDDFTRYEAVGFALADTAADMPGRVMDLFPHPESALRVERFFPNLLQIYDLRFPYIAASLTSLKRRFWSRTSPAFQSTESGTDAIGNLLGYEPRME